VLVLHILLQSLANIHNCLKGKTTKHLDKKILFENFGGGVYRVQRTQVAERFQYKHVLYMESRSEVRGGGGKNKEPYLHQI